MPNPRWVTCRVWTRNLPALQAKPQLTELISWISFDKLSSFYNVCSHTVQFTQIKDTDLLQFYFYFVKYYSTRYLKRADKIWIIKFNTVSAPFLLGGLKEFLPQVFPRGNYYVPCQKRLCKIKYSFDGSNSNADLELC